MTKKSITYNFKKLILEISIFIIINLILLPLIMYVGFEPNWIYFLIIGFISWWISGFTYHMIFMVMVHKVTIVEFDNEYYHFTLNYQLGFNNPYEIKGVIKSIENNTFKDTDLQLLFHNELSKKLFKRCIDNFCEINFYGKRYLLKLIRNDKVQEKSIQVKKKWTDEEVREKGKQFLEELKKKGPDLGKVGKTVVHLRGTTNKEINDDDDNDYDYPDKTRELRKIRIDIMKEFPKSNDSNNENE
jgi:hypothetical protein